MAESITPEYEVILDAARKLAPADQLKLAQALVSGDHLATLWENWQRQLATHGQIASDVEIDEIVARARAERRRGKR